MQYRGAENRRIAARDSQTSGWLLWPNTCPWGSVDRDQKLSDFCIFYGKFPFFNIEFTGFGGNATTFPKYHFLESYDFFFMRRLP